MYKSCNPSCLVVAALAIVALVGCGVSDQAKQQAADAVAELEAKTAQMFAAFDSGDPKAADGPMHQINAPFKLMVDLESKIGLDPQGVAALKEAQVEVLSAYKELHDPLHEPVFPEDFDFAPVRVKLIDAFAALRAALPADVAARLPESPLTAAPPSKAAEDPATAAESEASS